MQRALRVDSNEIIGADIFDKEVGHGGLKPGNVELRDSGRCIYCKQPVLIKAGTKRVRHFAHRPSANPGYCPIREKDTDASVSMPIEQKISEDCYITLNTKWHGIYVVMAQHVEGFALSEFWGLLDIAKKSQLFHRKGIVSWMIPYMLMALRDFDPASAFKRNGQNQRKRKIRFFFASFTRQSFKRSIWVEAGGLPRLFKWHPELEGTDPEEIKVNADWMGANLTVRWITESQAALTKSKIATIK